MIGQKLTNILQSFDPDEFRKLKRAFQSPYFATNDRLLVLYDYLKKHYPIFSPEKLKKEKLFKKVYPDKAYNDGVLRVLIREFTTVTEDFMMMERLRNDKKERKKMLVREYGHRNLYEYFKKGTQDLLSSMEEGFIKDVEYYNESTDLLQEYCFHPLTDNYDADDESLEQLMEGLDSYFVLAKYRFVQLLRNKNTILKKKSKFRFYEMVKEEKGDIFDENKLIQLYGQLDQLHDKGDDKTFYELKENLFSVINNLRRTDCRIVFYIGLNYCSRQINSGKVHYHAESFEWYKKGLELDLLTENGMISDATFNNVINAACYEKQYKWAEKFIEDHGHNLNEQVRDDAMNFAKSTLFIVQKEFMPAIHLLTSNKYSKSYQLRTRVITIKAMLEQALKDPEYFNVLYYQLEASQKFLQRDNFFSDAKKAPIGNFIKITSSLSKKIGSREDIDKIKSWFYRKIESDKNMVLLSWLTEKVENLKY